MAIDTPISADKQETFFKQILSDFENGTDSAVIQQKIKQALSQGLDINTQTAHKSQTTLFQLAVIHNDIDTMNWLIKQGANPRLVNKAGRNAAHYVQSEEAAHILRQNLVDMNLRDSQNLTPLEHHLSAGTKDPKITLALLDNGADPLLTNTYGQFPLNYVLEDTIETGPQNRHLLITAMSNEQRNKAAYYRIKQAIERKKENETVVDLIRQEMANGFDIHYQPDEEMGRSVLHMAANEDDIESVKMLQNAGLDINQRTLSGETVIHFANTPQMVHDLVNLGANIDATELDGPTALVRQVEYDVDPAIIQAFVEAGADVTAQDEEGHSLLSLTENPDLKNGARYKEIIEQALENKRKEDFNTSVFNHSADIYEKQGDTNSLRTDLQQAIANGYDVNFRYTNALDSALIHLATWHNDIETVKTLQKANADINLTDGTDRTAAHFAQTPEMVNFLANSGADLNKVDYAHMTPVIYAAFSDRFAVAQALAENGATLEGKDEEGKTVFDYLNETQQEQLRAAQQRYEERTKTGTETYTPASTVEATQQSETEQQPQNKVETKTPAHRPHNRAHAEWELTKATELAHQAGIEFPEDKKLSVEELVQRAIAYEEARRAGTLVEEQPMTVDQIYALANERKEAARKAFEAAGKEMPKELDMSVGTHIPSETLGLEAETATPEKPEDILAQMNAESHEQALPDNQLASASEPTPVPTVTPRIDMRQSVKEVFREKTPEEKAEAEKRQSEYKKWAYNETVYNKIVEAYQRQAAYEKEPETVANWQDLKTKKEENLKQISADIQEAIANGYDVNYSAVAHEYAPIAHIVAAGNDIETLKILKNAGADLNRADENGRTVAHKAVSGEMIQYLAEQNVNMNQQDRNGMTPLIYNLNAGNKFETIAPLMRAGANIDMTDNNGKSAWDYATPSAKSMMRITEQSIRDEYKRQAEKNEFDETTLNLIEKAKQRSMAKKLLAEEVEKREKAAKEATEQTDESELSDQEAVQAEQENAYEEQNNQTTEQAAEAAEQQLILEESDSKTNTQTESEMPPVNTEKTDNTSDETAEEVPEMTLRHQFGETIEQHQKALAHSVKRNQRIKSTQREKALDNIRHMEELGLIAKGPDGESNAAIYLYKIYQSTRLLTPESELHLDMNQTGAVEKIRANELLSSTDGKSHKQVYRLLTTKKLSETELKKLADMVNNVEFLINERGEVVSDIPQSVGRNKKRTIAKAQVFELEEPLHENEIAFTNTSSETQEESSKDNKDTKLKDRLSEAQNESLNDTTSKLTLNGKSSKSNMLSEKLNKAQTHKESDSEYVYRGENSKMS